MRAGTQTLIQALQALPWATNSSSDNEEDGHDIGTGESDSDEETPTRKQNFSIHEASPTYFLRSVKRLASSIHTIHRPLARSQRVPIPDAFNTNARPPKKKRVNLEDVSSDDDDMENDFEDTPRITGAVPSQFIKDSTTGEEDPTQERGGSLPTIRLHRRMHLAEKLKQVFELEDIHEVLTGMQSVV
jgi:sterol 3beta-glucosyltransferase